MPVILGHRESRVEVGLLRVDSADGDRDIRLPFRNPVDDVTGLSQAIRVLIGCPFVNGLRARRD